MRLFLVLSLFAAVAANAAAVSTLDVAAALFPLIGVPTDGYHQVIAPATLFDTADGSGSVTATRGGYSGGYADVYGAATSRSTARFGLLTETTSATARGFTAYASAGSGGNAASAVDIITVHGAGSIPLTMHARLTGGIAFSSTNNVVDGTTARVRSQISVSPYAALDHSKEIELDYDFIGQSAYDSVLNSTINVANGDTLNVVARIEQGSSVQLLNGAYDNQAARTVSVGTLANLGYWITLPGGAFLTSNSGYLYTAPVPEPASMFALGLASVCALRRRARKAA